jgi:hypothetical protein
LTAGNNLANDNLGTAQPWRAALYLGLVSSTFSTIVSQLSAGRIGRDAAVDWMCPSPPYPRVTGRFP